MLGFGGGVQLKTERLILRTPQRRDFLSWRTARIESGDHLKPWEPVWSSDHLTLRSFRSRVAWSKRAVRMARAYPLFLIDPTTGEVIGAATLDNIRRGPSQTGTLGYWLSASHTGQGLMREAVDRILRYAFDDLGLGRVEAGTLPENTPSRRLLEATGFKYEGVAQAYLQINGRWRDHVLYAALRNDRRGVAHTD
ncbi:MAG: GNAT family N-acetyltransferase [Pikeienuella sp.]